MTDFTLSNYTAIIFDLDSTLINTHRYPLRASMWILEKITDDVEAIADEYLQHLIRNYRKGIQEVAEGAEYRKPFDVVKRAIKESMTAMNIDIDDALLEEGTHLFRWLHVETSEVYPGVEELLIALKERGMKIGVVTNGFEKHIQIILSKLNLLHYFASMVDGGDVKAFKPMALPFQRAMDNLGVGPKETLFVGDEYFADIVGSTSLGIDAVWVKSRGGNLDEMVAKYGESSRPKLVVDSTAELAQYL
ncbi:MAG: HAD-IA family hydrolase [Candidatus Thorarchaeota archaeon]|nr:HAD-IA family hydrolase [Candidatus Thorarchaeota archaeon]